MSLFLLFFSMCYCSVDMSENGLWACCSSCSSPCPRKPPTVPFPELGVVMNRKGEICSFLSLIKSLERRWCHKWRKYNAWENAGFCSPIQLCTRICLENCGGSRRALELAATQILQPPWEGQYLGLLPFPSPFPESYPHLSFSHSSSLVIILWLSAFVLHFHGNVIPGTLRSCPAAT